MLCFDSSFAFLRFGDSQFQHEGWDLFFEHGGFVPGRGEHTGDLGRRPLEGGGRLDQSRAGLGSALGGEDLRMPVATSGCCALEQ